jgi:hypothetical protein
MTLLNLTCPLAFVKAAAFAAGIALSSIAHAQGMQTKCQTALCVWDAQDMPVGLISGGGSISTVNRFMNGQWYQLNYSTNLGLTVNNFLLYEGLNCAGQPYVTTGSRIGPADRIHPNEIVLTSPPPASFDGSAIWGPVGASDNLDYKSFLFEGVCTNGIWGPADPVAAPAAKLDVRVLQPPFTIH